MALADLSPLDLFMRLAAVSSPPGKERGVADLAIGFLGELGLETDEDGAGEAIGSEIGNVYCRVEPTAEGDALFLNAHLDTVPPTAAIEPVVEDGRVVNAQPTILGADNKAAVAAMLCAVRDLVREGRPHAGVELVLTPMEEVGLLGAKEFDTGRLHARFGYCYDHAAPIGNIVLAAPWQQSFTIAFAGRAAHSGIAPEDGRSAILAAARAIAEMPLGRIDAETTANVGLIEGGVAGNIVPPRCVFRAEARSRDRDRLEEVSARIVDAANRAANATGCEAEISLRSEYVGYRLSPSSKAGQADLLRTARQRHRAGLHRVRRRRRRQRVQRRRCHLCKRVQRHGRDPHAGRAHRRRRHRSDDGRHALADRSFVESRLKP